MFYIYSRIHLFTWHKIKEIVTIIFFGFVFDNFVHLIMFTMFLLYLEWVGQFFVMFLIN